MRPRHEAKFNQMKKLLQKPRSVRELVTKTGASERSVYRWITRLNGSVVRKPGRSAVFVLTRSK